MLARERHKAGRPKGRARLAALCGIVLPGLGAVYNRQNVKAIVHFVTTIALFKLTALDALEPFFALGGFGFYIYTIIDAYRTAQAIAGGESAASNEERFKRQLARLSPTIGLVAIVCGILFVLQSLRPFGLDLSLSRVLPVGLIFLGGYLLTRYFKRSRDGGDKPEYTRPPYA
ncbi:MAG TPA: hypothetical protein VNO70_25065, partial [Blastocatellia bacterium]|nr:hypothetical protein [Blastocatellia bacterium]